MFAVIYDGPHGPTVQSDNPKLDAYREAAYVRHILDRGYLLTAHDDGAYTVQGDGLMPLTFQGEQQCATT